MGKIDSEAQDVSQEGAAFRYLVPAVLIPEGLETGSLVRVG